MQTSWGCTPGKPRAPLVGKISNFFHFLCCVLEQFADWLVLHTRTQDTSAYYAAAQTRSETPNNPSNTPAPPNYDTDK